MNSSAMCLSDEELTALRRMMGRRVPWIFGTPFLTERALTVALRLAMLAGGSRSDGTDGECVSFGSERFETRKDNVDYARFRVEVAISLGRALGTTGSMYIDTSALVDLGAGRLDCVRVLADSVEEDEYTIHYDAVIRFEFDDGRTLSIGHAPGVYEGVCVTLGEAVTLGNPKHLWERVVIAERVTKFEPSRK